MPAPERTTLAAIVDTARALLEERGPDGVTMQAVAERVGVRAPSLYKRVRDRSALLTMVADAGIQDLIRMLADADDPADLARAYRRFGHEQPNAFRLIFTPAAPQASLELAADLLIRAVEPITGTEHALEGARMVTAWTTGFVHMELAGAFRMGGDVDDAFDYGLTRILRALRP